MGDFDAQHYLEIYRHRLHNAERGITHPTPEVVEETKRLVAALACLESTTKIQLQIQTGRAVFSVAATGKVLAEIKCGEFAEPAASQNGGLAKPPGDLGAAEGRHR